MKLVENFRYENKNIFKKYEQFSMAVLGKA